MAALKVTVADAKAPLATSVVRKLTNLLTVAGRLRKWEIESVGIAFVAEPIMRELNTRYRKHRFVTDVLSFAYQARPLVGELIICRAQAARQAKRQKHTLTRELLVLAAHGYLHLMGLDHMKPSERKQMRQVEQQLLSEIG